MKLFQLFSCSQCKTVWLAFGLIQYFSYIMVISFIGGVNRSTRRKPLTCRKSLTTFIKSQCCIKNTLSYHEQHSNDIKSKTETNLSAQIVIKGNLNINSRTLF